MIAISQCAPSTKPPDHAPTHDQLPSLHNIIPETFDGLSKLEVDLQVEHGIQHLGFLAMA